MLNIVEKYSAESAVETEDGVVAIEYVVVAAAIVIALSGLWSAFGATLANELNDIVDGITDPAWGEGQPPPDRTLPFS